MDETMQDSRNPWIAISLGPLGAMLGNGTEYRGDYADQGIDGKQLIDFHRDQLEAVLEAANRCSLQRYVIAWETLSALEEAKAVAVVIGEFEARQSSLDTDQSGTFTAIIPPCWIAFSCRDERSVSDGHSVQTCVQAVHQLASVAAVGVNCIPRQWLASLVRQMHAVSFKPVVCYANGRPWDAERSDWLDEPAVESVRRFCETTLEAQCAGATVLGGCCAAGPEHISALRDALKTDYSWQ
jgi:homocysteine S-methyltransferase